MSEATELLSPLFTGECTPDEAISIVRPLAKERQNHPAIYDALSLACWRVVSIHVTPDIARRWFDVCRQASSLLRAHKSEDFAERALALADQCLSTARFGETHSLHAILNRPYVIDILRAVDNRGRAHTERRVIEAATGIGKANLSKLLGVLEAANLVQRHRQGQRVNVSLTDLGKRVLSQKPPEPGTSQREAKAPDMSSISMEPNSWREARD